MTDTSQEAAALHRRLLMQRSGEERLHMGCEMFGAARTIVLASLTAATVAKPDCELRIQLLRRTYGGDLAPDVLARVEERIRGGAA